MRILVYALLGIISVAPVWGVACANEAKQLQIQWSVDVDQRQPNSPVALSSPAVLNQGGETLVVLAGRDGWVHVYDEKGAEQRRVYLGVPSDSVSLALQNGLVVIGDVVGGLYGVDPAKGKIVWKTSLTAEFTSAMVAVGNDFLVQTTDNRVYRFSQDGVKKWSSAGQISALSMYLNAPPLVAGDAVYALLTNGDAVALKLSTGDLLWKRQLLLSNVTAVLSDLKAPLSSPVFVQSLNMDGESLKDSLLMPFFQGDMIVLAANDGSQGLSLPLSLKSSPVIVDNVLYAADSTGFLHAYDIVKGSRLWSKRVAEDELSGLLIWKQSLWMTDNKGMVYNADMQGNILASLELAGSIIRMPVVSEGGLLVRTERGVMYMVNQ